MYSAKGHLASPRWGCPIRTSPDQSLLAAPRGLSQPSTSFIGSWCQGIHRAPLLARRLDLSTSPSRQDQRSQKDTIKKLYVLSAQIPVRLSHALPRLNLMPAQLLFDSSGAIPTLSRAPVVAPRPATLRPGATTSSPAPLVLVLARAQKWPDDPSSHVANTTIRQRKPMRLATPACG